MIEKSESCIYSTFRTSATKNTKQYKSEMEKRIFHQMISGSFELVIAP